MTTLFVYGTLMTGQRNHHLLVDAKLLGPAVTTRRFTLLNLGRCPGVITGGRTAIAGELYQVDDRLLSSLDKHEGHPFIYKRRTVPVRRLGEGWYDDVWIYTLQLLGRALYRVRNFRFPVIESGDWKQIT